MKEVTVQSLGLDRSSNTPVVILQEKDGSRVLPIWIGPGEASAIAMELAGMNFSRPLTHDLMTSAIRGLGGSLTRVVITRVVDNTYYAEMIIARDGEYFSLDARPSDSIAMALRMDADHLHRATTSSRTPSIEISENVRLRRRAHRPGGASSGRGGASRRPGGPEGVPASAPSRGLRAVHAVIHATLSARAGRRSADRRCWPCWLSSRALAGPTPGMRRSLREWPSGPMGRHSRTYPWSCTAWAKAARASIATDTTDAEGAFRFVLEGGGRRYLLRCPAVRGRHVHRPRRAGRRGAGRGYTLRVEPGSEAGAVASALARPGPMPGAARPSAQTRAAGRAGSDRARSSWWGCWRWPRRPRSSSRRPATGSVGPAMRSSSWPRRRTRWTGTGETLRATRERAGSSASGEPASPAEEAAGATGADMPLVTVDAIVLQAFPYSETSKILRLLTRSARGAERDRQGCPPGEEPLSAGSSSRSRTASASFYLKSNRDLHTLREFELQRPRQRIGARPGAVRRRLAHRARSCSGRPATRSRRSSFRRFEPR